MKILITLSLLVMSSISLANTQWLESAAGNYSGYGSEFCSEITLKMGPSRFFGSNTGTFGPEAAAVLSIRNSDNRGYTIHFDEDTADVRGDKLTLKTNHMGDEYGDVAFGKVWQRTELTLYKNANGLKRVEFATWRYNPMKIWTKKPLDGTLRRVTCDL